MALFITAEQPAALLCGAYWIRFTAAGRAPAVERYGPAAGDAEARGRVIIDDFPLSALLWTVIAVTCDMH